jgi:hypothetical protein
MDKPNKRSSSSSSFFFDRPRFTRCFFLWRSFFFTLVPEKTNKCQSISVYFKIGHKHRSYEKKKNKNIPGHHFQKTVHLHYPPFVTTPTTDAQSRTQVLFVSVPFEELDTGGAGVAIVVAPENQYNRKKR